MPQVRAGGVDHYYEWIINGHDNPGVEKPVLVFVHGWAGSSRYWRSTAQALKERFDCLLYDMRGFGRSQLTVRDCAMILSRGYQLSTFADDLAELLDALGLSQRVYLNAHSMGASVAVFFLNRYRDRVERAILTCNGIFEYDQAAFEAFYRFGRYVVMFRPQWLAQIPLAPRVFMSRFLHQPIPAAERRSFLQDFLDADFDIALGTIFTSVSKEATEVMPMEFQQLAMPTLLVSGEFDKITPANLGEKAAALNPLIQYCVVARTGHFPMLEDSETYLQAVTSFLSQSP